MLYSHNVIHPSLSQELYENVGLSANYRDLHVINSITTTELMSGQKSDEDLKERCLQSNAQILAKRSRKV